LLDVTRPVGLLRPGTTGNLPDDVRRVQYLFNKTSVADGGPDFVFDTTRGACGQDLIDAITTFQKFNSLANVDGRVDVGLETITNLNQVADLSAFAAVREPDEFLSWLRRPPEWNFTLEDRLGLGATPFTFGPETVAWLPEVYRTNLVQLFECVLDPAQRPAGSWGVGPWDLYHGHVAVNSGAAADPSVSTVIRPVQNVVTMISNLRNAKHPERLTAANDLAAYATSLFALLTGLHDPLTALAATGQALLYYHSFESSTLLGDTSRYAGYQPFDPRRNWLVPLGSGSPSQYASADHPDDPFKDFSHVIGVNFVVDKTGRVGAVADTKQELVAFIQQPYGTIA
jgi:hypothetical protein